MPAKHWPSVIDVLILPQEDVSVRNFADNARMVEEQVRRNLTSILNARRNSLLIPDHFEDMRESPLYYGIPDFSRHGFDNSKQRRGLSDEIRRTILAFEPRLKKVQVLDLNDDANLSRLLTFRISGDLQVYPRPQQVEFDSRLDRVTSLFEVDSK